MTGDLAKGAGIEPPVAGVAIIVHCAGNGMGNEEQTRNLIRVASRAGARHLVYISVGGAIDRVIGGYFASKRAAERVVAEFGVPWTAVRATQFYDLILLPARGMTKLPVVPVPAGF